MQLSLTGETSTLTCGGASHPTTRIAAFGVCPTEATTMYAVVPVCPACYRASVVRDAHYFEPTLILQGCRALRVTQAGEAQGVGA